MSRQHDFASIRRTAAELARDPGPQPPLGQFLWKPTRQVRLPWPIASVSGRYREEGVYCQCRRGTTTYYRSHRRPADPKTSRQLEQRGQFGRSQSDWKTLTQEERDGWTAYGKRWFPEEGSSSPGPNAYTKAKSCRRGWGEMTMTHTPPVLPPPPAPLALEEVPAPESGLVAFRVAHSLGQMADGYRIELRMTRATVNGRKPQEPEFSRAGETAPESFFPLAESRADYLLERPRFDVAPGERFGLGVRLITPEGIPGPELRVDLIRKAPEAPEEPEGLAQRAEGRRQKAGTEYAYTAKAPNTATAGTAKRQKRNAAARRARRRGEKQKRKSATRSRGEPQEARGKPEAQNL